MINRFAQAFVILAAAAIPVALMAGSAGPPTKGTGAPVDGGMSCMAYHGTDPSAYYYKRGRFSIQTGAYTPGGQAAGLAPQSISGLHQFNVRVPASTGDGNIPISIRMGSYETPKGTTIAVKK